jgi:hypothetical protein
MSQNIDKLIEEIYADGKVSVGEIMRLRSAVRERTAAVIAEAGDEGVVAALCKSFDVTTQLLQESLLRVRKDKWTDTGRAIVASMIGAHIELLQANLEAFK